MGYTELIAKDVRHYIDLAVQLAADPASRARASKAIHESCGALYDDVETVRDLESCWLSVRP
jgi:predicted O-linked N-acetylglucosamine transferase (SPINDLY family)